MNIADGGQFTDAFSANIANYTTLSSFTSEASLLAGTNRLPFFPPGFFNRVGKMVRLRASGVLASTGTPTYTFDFLLHTAAVTATSSVSGTTVGVSAAITTGNGVTDQQWEAWVDLTTVIPGVGTGAMTLIAKGWFISGGVAAPYIYPLQPTTPPNATWTVTLDGSLTYHPNLTVICSASSASNAITCKKFDVISWN